jgi:transketolase
VYIRLTGGLDFPIFYPEDFDFGIGKAIGYRGGSDVAFISTESLLAEAVGAADILESKGISTRVNDMHTLKPLDQDILYKVFAKNRLIVTVDEHSCIGGLEGAVAEYKAGFADTPGQVMASLGGHAFHLEDNGLRGTGPAALAEKNLS